MNQRVSEHDIQAFVAAINTFFRSLAPEPPEIRTAYLAESDEAVSLSDFTGVVRVSGQYRGSVWFSAPRPMLRKVLMYMNEPSLTDENFLDVAGEIANIFAGNARRHFGDALEISPPELHVGLPATERGLASRPVVIVVTWERYKASIIVDLVGD